MALGSNLSLTSSSPRLRPAAAAEATCKALALDGLIVIGGDDSNTNTAVLAEYFLQRGESACQNVSSGDFGAFFGFSFGCS
jgi:6-phosphofructokinase